MQPACLGVPSPSVQSLPSPSLRVCTYWCTFTCRPKFLAPVGHFRVFLGLCIKTRLSAQPLISKWFVILMQIKLISMRKVEYLASFFGTPRWCIRKGLKICHLHISHNTTCLPPPPPPQKGTKVLHILGGSNKVKVYYGKLFNGEYKHCTLSATLQRLLFLLLFVRRLSMLM